MDLSATIPPSSSPSLSSPSDAVKKFSPEPSRPPSWLASPVMSSSLLSLSPPTLRLKLSMLRAESDRASLRTLADAGEHGFGDVPLRADSEPLVSSLLDLAWALATSRERVEPVRRRLQGRKLTSDFFSTGPSTSSLPTSSSSRSLLLLELVSVSLSSIVASGAVTPILIKLASILSTSMVFSVC